MTSVNIFDLNTNINIINMKLFGWFRNRIKVEDSTPVITLETKYRIVPLDEGVFTCLEYLDGKKWKKVPDARTNAHDLGMADYFSFDRYVSSCNHNLEDFARRYPFIQIWFNKREEVFQRVRDKSDKIERSRLANQQIKYL